MMEHLLLMCSRTRGLYVLGGSVLLLQPPGPDDLALICFTSGTTGKYMYLHSSMHVRHFDKYFIFDV